jgi:hypothetical protein
MPKGVLGQTGGIGQGRDFRLTDVEGEVISQRLA